jgi:hypothetical protein
VTESRVIGQARRSPPPAEDWIGAPYARFLATRKRFIPFIYWPTPRG